VTTAPIDRDRLPSSAPVIGPVAAVFTAGAGGRAWDPEPSRLAGLRARIRPLRAALKSCSRCARGGWWRRRRSSGRGRCAPGAGERARDLALKQDAARQDRAAAEPGTVIRASPRRSSGRTWRRRRPGPSAARGASLQPGHLIPLVELFTPDPAAADHATPSTPPSASAPSAAAGDPGQIAGRLAAASAARRCISSARGCERPDIDAALVAGPACAGPPGRISPTSGAGPGHRDISSIGPTRGRWATLASPGWMRACAAAWSPASPRKPAGAHRRARAERDAALVALERARAGQPPIASSGWCPL
jgi:hypothetical protein